MAGEKGKMGIEPKDVLVRVCVCVCVCVCV